MGRKKVLLVTLNNNAEAFCGIMIILIILLHNTHQNKAMASEGDGEDLGLRICSES
jgi:hypothetical protein